MQPTAPHRAACVFLSQAALGRTSSVRFRLANILDEPVPFKAFFSLESSTEFDVLPARGELPPASVPGACCAAPRAGWARLTARARGAEAEQALFEITFTPKSYGRVQTATLIIQVRAHVLRQGSCGPTR
jgi:hypothetical protein